MNIYLHIYIYTTHIHVYYITCQRIYTFCSIHISPPLDSYAPRPHAPSASAPHQAVALREAPTVVRRHGASCEIWAKWLRGVLVPICDRRTELWSIDFGNVSCVHLVVDIWVEVFYVSLSLSLSLFRRREPNSVFGDVHCLLMQICILTAVGHRLSHRSGLDESSRRNRSFFCVGLRSTSIWWIPKNRGKH